MPRILLIDDDAPLRGVIAMSLASVGHEVIEAANGREGVELARASVFDVVVTDLVMPEQEGMETISILRRERPRLPVIAMSGGLAHSDLYLNIAQKIGAKRILAKPFPLAELAAAIAEVLSSATAPPMPPRT